MLGDSGFGEQSFEVSVELAGTLQLKGSIGGSSELVIYGRDPGTVCVDVWFVRSGVVDVGEGREVDVVGFLVWHDESGKKLARVARDARAVLESGDSTVKEVDSLVVFDEADNAALSKDSTLIVVGLAVREGESPECGVSVSGQGGRHSHSHGRREVFRADVLSNIALFANIVKARTFPENVLGGVWLDLAERA